MQQPDALQARRILKFQVILGLVLVVLALPFGGSVALSVLIGAGICLLANALLAIWVFRGLSRPGAGEIGLAFLWWRGRKDRIDSRFIRRRLCDIDNLNIPVLLGAYFVVQVIPTLIAAQLGNRTTK